VGTAAKGETVSIVRQCKPFKVFLEDIPHPVRLQPSVVKELSHPINIGRDFLGHHQGRLEFSPSQGFLEIHGKKANLITKSEKLVTSSLADGRLKKVAGLEKAGEYSVPEVVIEGVLNALQDHKLKSEPIPGYAGQSVEIPALSEKLMPISTHGKLPLRVATEYDLLIERKVTDEGTTLTLPGGCAVMEGKAYGFIVNPSSHGVQVKEGEGLGVVWLCEVEGELQGEEEGLHKGEKTGPQGLSDGDRRDWLSEKLGLNNNPELTADPELKAAILQAFEENWEAVSQHDFNYGYTDGIQCQIRLKPGEEEPVRLKAWPLNPLQEASMRKQIDEWEKTGAIEKTQSPWAFPMVGVKKKDSETLRWCVDYRLLNKKMIKDAYPLPSIESNLHKLQGARYFSTLDSTRAYHAVEIHPESREYTAFITPVEQFQLYVCLLASATPEHATLD